MQSWPEPATLHRWVGVDNILVCYFYQRFLLLLVDTENTSIVIRLGLGIYVMNPTLAGLLLSQRWLNGRNVIIPAWCCSCINKSCLTWGSAWNHLPVSASTALVICNPDKLPMDNESWLHFYTRTTSVSNLQISYSFSLIWLCHVLTVRFCHLSWFRLG